MIRFGAKPDGVLMSHGKRYSTVALPSKPKNSGTQLSGGLIDDAMELASTSMVVTSLAQMDSVIHKKS